jgi:hypothetical protein
VVTLSEYYQIDFPVEYLEKEANLLNKPEGPWSVTDNKKLVIGLEGGIHDYNSMAEHYWQKTDFYASFG